MPVDPILFPTAYPALCPGTVAVSTVIDPIEEVKRLLYVSRQQSNAGIRQTGQALAELQNQSIPAAWRVLRTLQPADAKAATITNPAPVVPNPPALPPVPVAAPAEPVTPAPIPALPSPVVTYQSVGKAFYGGGDNNGVYRQIDRMWISKIQIEAAGIQLMNPRFRHASLTSNTHGYWAGGQTNPDVTSKSLDVEAVNFGDNRRRLGYQYLTKGRSYCVGIWRPDKGFVLASHRPNDNTVDRVDLITEAVTLSAQTLAASIGGLSGSQYPAASSNGYVASGLNGSLQIQRVDLGAELITGISAQLTTNRSLAASSTSTTRTHWHGGQSTTTGTTYRTTDAIAHANEQALLAAYRLSTERFDCNALSAFIRSFISGNRLAKTATEIEIFDPEGGKHYVSQTRLSRGGSQCVPTGKP